MTTTRRRRPLRVKLTILMVLLLSIGLFVSSFIATTALRGYLLDRIDEVLVSDSTRFKDFGGAPPPIDTDDSGRPARPPSRFYLEIVRSDGTPSVVLSTPESDPGVTPVVPSMGELPMLTDGPFTVGSVDGNDQWRMKVTVLSSGAGWAITAFPLADVQATVARLVLLQFLVGLAVVVVAGAIGYLLVRRSLQPLDDVAATAREIAAGDLTLRVSDDASSTEVHELSTSFNTMVTRIEESFAAQQESESQARASEERMRRFVADAGHELRTPLTSIRGYAELLEQGAAQDPEIAVSRIQDEAVRMGSLVDDLQLLARLDQQRPLDKEVIDVRDVVSAAVQAAEATQPDRPIPVEVAGPAPIVNGDGRQLRQVLDNLLSNAIRYSPQGSAVEVTIVTVPDEEPSIVRVDVVDHGIGLSPDECERVFERLYRTDEARSRVYGGSGLGLAIVKSIVEAHGGRVLLTSTPGEGSDFGFTLPYSG
jgi:two-component system OmpR family sensor kinase